MLRPIEFGAAGLQNFGDPIKGSSHGLIGALVIEPPDATWETDCQILRNADPNEAPKDCLNAASTVTIGLGRLPRVRVVYQNDVEPSLSRRGAGEPPQRR